MQSEKDPLDPLTAFVGFGCSYSGKWFGGLAKDGNGRNYALNAYNSLMKKAKTFKDVEFSHKSYLDYTPTDYLVYCDPRLS